MIALTVATAALVAALLVVEGLGRQMGKWIFKPLASAGFVALAVAAGAPGSRHGCAVLAALVLSWLGDVLLIPRSRSAFRVGLLSFLLGHVGFAVAFLLRGVDLRVAAGAAVALAIPAILIGLRLLPRVDAKLRGPVTAYIAVISTMVALAAGTVAAGGRPLLLVAALAFYLSDLSVARDRFVAPGFINRLWGLPLYYGAQILFAWTIV